ncbi:MAG: hypothetical protein B7Z60_06885 [Ferrovum sp. 37-45-19]|nr:hypothetical protein FERRO_00220 [Ferrovum sp. JA12]OYV78773.1 MAG: hypothetical protein B7Z65_08960 [Ferrovum sp. 21-44-67]OYV93921.1 MAG: hypothetical protein B7Z60_06885 [Ferrovum sp. 37-45-19]OZB32011.1 MAG: hypothetical protein B7X47_07775 [Ferrovum sp. 34-44-207]
MKKITILLCVCFFSLNVAPLAHADRGWGLGLGFLAGTVVGSQLAYPYYGRPIIYAPPTVVYSQPVYAQPAPPQVFQYQPSAPGGVWYFCSSLGAYYPYVSQCPEAWQTVPSTPR